MTGQSVYFAAACGKIKIGCSNDPAARIASVGEWIPFPITLMATMPGGYAMESAIHRMFDDEWSHGEWFNTSSRLLDFIAGVAEGRPLNIDAQEIATRRRIFIADKKRLSHRLNRLRKAGHELPAPYPAKLDKVRKGEPVPPALLEEVNGAIDALLSDTPHKGEAAA